MAGGEFVTPVTVSPLDFLMRRAQYMNRRDQ
jgi:hypothetical protein